MSAELPNHPTLVELRALVRALGILVRATPVRVGISMLSGLTGGIGPAAAIVATSAVVDVVASNRNARAATVPIVVAGVTMVLASLGSAYESLNTGLIGERFAIAVRQRLIESVGSLPGLAHFEDPASANRLQLATQSSSPLALVRSLVGMFGRAASVVAAGAVAAQLAWWAPAIVLATAVPGFVNGWLHGTRQTRLSAEGAEERRRAAYHAGLALTLPAAKEIRLFGLGSWVADRQASAWLGGWSPTLRDLRAQARHGVAIGAAKSAVAGVPFVVATLRAADGRMSVGAFTAAVLALGVLVTAAWGLEMMFGSLRRDLRFLPELFDVIDLPRTDPRLRARGTAAPPRDLRTGIRFEGVRFTYPGTGRVVLDGVDLEIPAGTSLALVGENGAGKSTLVKLLCRFYDPDDGRITLDGVDLRDLDVAELRNRMACVFQDFVRYPMSAARNVGLGDVSRLDDRALAVDAASRAGAVTVVEALPDGWDTVLAREFGGSDLSGGEWQRIALARAMASHLGRDAPILILDEPTASLDVRVEHDLYERFASITSGRTTLLISHRFSTVRMADRVAVLEAGRVVECGPHVDLVANGGRYAELYDLQARRFRETGTLA